MPAPLLDPLTGSWLAGRLIPATGVIVELPQRLRGKRVSEARDDRFSPGRVHRAAPSG